ncbi:hypothetical protein [Psychrobacillus sp. FSL K6-1267]|uniref:hypothetical protein n=1 Tax=Psychrobacillus sp. FSL K6-1267 TaxID=2921543 RepID=UPI0030F9C37A
MLTTRTRKYNVIDGTINSSMPETNIISITGKGMLKTVRDMTQSGNRAQYDLTFRVYIDGNLISTESNIQLLNRYGIAVTSQVYSTSYNLPFEQEFRITLEIKPSTQTPPLQGFRIDLDMLFIMES